MHRTQTILQAEPTRARGRFSVARTLAPLALALFTASAIGCNSDETFSEETGNQTTGDDFKTPPTSLPMTTRGGEPDLGGSDGPFVSCSDMMECLYGPQSCSYFNDQNDLELDFVCILGCVGTEGAEFGELLWKLDLAMCLSDVCATEPYTGMDDPAPEFWCNPDPSIGLDLSTNCLQCVVLKLAEIANGVEYDVCTAQIEKCDDDPDTP